MAKTHVPTLTCSISTMAFTIIWMIAFWSVSIVVTNSATFQPQLISLLQSLNASTNDTLFPSTLQTGSQRCTEQSTWLSPVYTIEDCKSALLYFYFEELARGDKRRMEFLDRDTPPITRWRPQRTPRKYTFRKLTLV